MKDSVVFDCVILFSVAMLCSTQQTIDRATKHKVKKAIDNIVGGFVQEEERNSEPGNSFGCNKFFLFCYP